MTLPHLFTLILLLSVKASAACDIDSSFGSAGRSDHAAGVAAIGYASALLSNGNLVVVGASDNGSNVDAAAWVLNSAGSLQAGGNLDNLAGGAGDDAWHAVVIEPGENAIIVAGESMGTTVNCFVMKRLLLPSLSSDASFGGTGTVILANNAAARSLAIDSSGRIYTAESGGLRRFSSAGAVDSSFGTGGAWQFDASGDPWALLFDASDRLLIAGSVLSGIAAWRATTSSVLDSSFGSSGKVSAAAGVQAAAYAIKLDASGNLALTGSIVYSGFSSSSMFVWRLAASGTPLPGFGTAGLSTMASAAGVTAYQEGHGLYVEGDGTVTVAGQTPQGLQPDATLWRLLPSGVLDSSFGSSGVLSYASQSGSMQSMAGLYATGAFASPMSVWKLSGCVAATATLTPLTTLITGQQDPGLGKCYAYPNPAKTAISFAFSLGAACKVTLLVYNERGQNVASKEVNLAAGRNSLGLSLGGFAPGVYLYKLRFENGDSPPRGKFVVLP